MVRDTDRSMSFAEVTGKLGNVMIQGHGSRGPNPQDMAIVTTGAQFAEVEVDVETGVVKVLRIVAVHDAGRIVNPTLAESQLEGGIIQGLGFALFEERRLDALDRLVAAGVAREVTGRARDRVYAWGAACTVAESATTV